MTANIRYTVEQRGHLPNSTLPTGWLRFTPLAVMPAGRIFPGWGN